MSTLEPIRWITTPNVRSPLAANRRPDHAAVGVWSLIDIVLASARLSNLTIVAATLGMAALCVWAGGLTGLISGTSALSVIGGAVAGLIRLGRERRCIRPPAHLPSRQPSAAIRWQAVG